MQTQEIENRKIKAHALISRCEEFCELEKDCYLIPSQNGNGKYKVCVNHNVWSCNCPDFQKRQQDCKHIFAIRFWLAVREKMKEETFESKMENNVKHCVYCYSDRIVKDGNRITNGTKKQKYLCRKCGRRFVFDVVWKTKGNGKIITLVMDLWFKGVSIRKIVDHLKQFYDFNIGKSTVQRWITHYSDLLNRVTDSMIPESSGRIHIDEQMIKSKGKYVYCWNAIDGETKYLLASVVTEGREKKDAMKVLEKVRKANPEVIITDRLMSYRKAIKRVYGDTVIHIANPSIRNKHSSNNAIERYHNNFRERDKVIRGFKSNKTAQNLINGYRFFYNFIRIHQGLRKTPAENSGLWKLEGNRWYDLMKIVNE